MAPREGLAVAFVGTGGDPGHEPARRFYETLGYRPFPVVQFYKALLVEETRVPDPSRPRLAQLVRDATRSGVVSSAAIFLVEPGSAVLELAAADGIEGPALDGLVAAVRQPEHPVARAVTDGGPTFDVLPVNPGGPRLRSHLPLAIDRRWRSAWSSACSRSPTTLAGREDERHGSSTSRMRRCGRATRRRRRGSSAPCWSASTHQAPVRAAPPIEVSRTSATLCGPIVPTAAAAIPVASAGTDHGNQGPTPIWASTCPRTITTSIRPIAAGSRATRSRPARTGSRG